MKTLNSYLQNVFVMISIVFPEVDMEIFIRLSKWPKARDVVFVYYAVNAVTAVWRCSSHEASGLISKRKQKKARYEKMNKKKVLTVVFVIHFLQKRATLLIVAARGPSGKQSPGKHVSERHRTKMLIVQNTNTRKCYCKNWDNISKS